MALLTYCIYLEFVADLIDTTRRLNDSEGRPITEGADPELQYQKENIKFDDGIICSEGDSKTTLHSMVLQVLHR